MRKKNILPVLLSGVVVSALAQQAVQLSTIIIPVQVKLSQFLFNQ